MADPNFAQATAARNAASAGGNDYSGAGYTKNVMHQTGGVDTFGGGGVKNNWKPSLGGPKGANASGFHSQGGSSLVFPSNLGTDPTQMNMIMFMPKEITGGGADPRTITFKSISGAPAVVLPIPSGLNTSYQQSWSGASVEGRNAMLADKGGNLINQMANALSKDTRDIEQKKEGTGGKTGTEILEQMFENFDPGGLYNTAIDSITSGNFWNETAGGVASELGAMVAAGPAEGLATAAQYTVGMRAVKQTMMSYGGPGFRSFSFTFSLKPFSSGESDIVSKILHTFKLYSAPNQNATRYTRVYDLPAVFKIMFLYGAQEHRHIAKIGHCALTNIGISYGGGKFSTFSGTHAPVQVDLTLSFQEMELLNRGMIDTEQYGGQWPRESSSSAGSFSSDFADPGPAGTDFFNG